MPGGKHMSDEFENRTNTDEQNQSVDSENTEIKEEVIKEQETQQETPQQEAPQEETYKSESREDGTYGYTKDTLPHRENDFRQSEDYNGYSNNNGYTNSNYSSESYSEAQTTQQSGAGYDKRAAKAAKKQEKIKRAAAKKAEKKQRQAMRKQQGPGFFVRAIRLIVMAVIFGAIAGGTMIGMGYGYRYFNDNSDKQISKTDTTASINTIEKQTEESDSDRKSSDTTKENADTTKSSGITITDVSDIVDEVMPSVVAITSTEIIKSAGNDLWSYFYGNGSGGNDQYETQGAGSGIIVGENDKELLIVTNQHVVADADSLSVQFYNEKSVEATVRGENEKQDIAVLSIPLSDIGSDTISAIKIATLGDSDKVKVGEGSIAIGNALGYGQSVTTGVISALNRTITVDNYDRTVLQTDAAINPGNSGGALLNMKGEVIGINCAKSTQNYSEGMGYTIPISLVKDLIDDMMTKEVKQKVSDNEKGYLNIYGKDVTSDLSQMYDIPEGVYIMDVIKDGAAEKAGLSKYDVITAVEGESISSMEELQEQLGYYKKGEKVKLTIETLEKNEYVEKEVEIELGDEME